MVLYSTCASARKQTEYALIALAYLAERESSFSSAREISAAYDLPAALLMKLLKCMHHRGLLRSIRGASGGYQLAQDLRTVSLLELDQMLRPEACCCDAEIEGESDRSIPTEPPLIAPYGIRCSDSFRMKTVGPDPARPAGIDVPLERVRY